MNGWKFDGQEVLLTSIIILWAALCYSAYKLLPRDEERIRYKLEIALPALMARRQAMRI
jgi:hypothetical protein